ncbi:hypothetical protein BGY98DRAFT_936696 [Russula aff. rugulosa BPL654]|nr:hypothetical protein BGY98DRAFT_936696 [Russula aff. rugulosa BPL654]
MGENGACGIGRRKVSASQPLLPVLCQCAPSLSLCEPGHHSNNERLHFARIDIQLKILQTLLSFITNFPTILDRLLKNVVEEDPRMFLANELESIALPDGTTQETTRVLGLAARDAFSRTSVCWVTESFAIPTTPVHSQDLFSRADRERTHQPTLPQGQQLSSNHSHLHSIPSSYSYYNTASSPVHQTLSERSAYPPPFRDTHVVFLLLQQFSSQLETEADLIPAALIKLINGKADADEPGPGWMWVLAMEIMRGLCSDSEFTRSIWQHYDTWQPTVAPAAPLAHASSPPSYPPSSSWSPHVPPCSASPLRCMVWVYLRATLNRTFIATQLRQRRGDVGEGCQRDGDDWHWAA